MIFLAIIILTLYASLVIWLLISWHGIKEIHQHNFAENIKWPFITVLIPVRNESSNIKVAVRSILDNDFPTNGYEVIVVNDHSTDNTCNVVELLIKENPQVRICHLPQKEEGKKRAITLGISESVGDIVLCTDGDCIVPGQWLGNYANAYMQRTKGKLVFGAVRYKGDRKWWVNFLNIELSVLVLTGAATISRGIPTMVNGANLSYLKEVFDDVGGYAENEQIPSGDDEFLIRKVHSKFNGKVYFIKDKKTIVETAPPSSITDLINQRRRWASKWKHHKDPFSKLLPMLVFFVNALSILFMFELILFQVSFETIGYLVFKATLELVLIHTSATFLGVKYRLLSFVLLEIIYPFYVVFIGIASNFGKYSWKDRAYSS